VDWQQATIAALCQQPVVGYQPTGKPAAEPTALAALALVAHGQKPAAQAAARWLADQQGASGAVGVRAGEAEPGWPTSLAVVAWAAVDRPGYQVPVQRAVRWLLAHRGKSIPRSEAFGHNSELVGWAYAENTHSWVEPTALAVLALCAAGRRDEPALGEAVTLLLDRQLPTGGWNYGNTYVLGQLIRPHLQPTGLALLALAKAGVGPTAVARSLDWLQGQLGPHTPAVSLGWSLLGLQAYRRLLAEAEPWLAAAATRPLPSLPPTSASPSEAPPTDLVQPLGRLALLALAAKGWPL
jgi:hypothetical protein